jgi:hypothetical protein
MFLPDRPGHGVAWKMWEEHWHSPVMRTKCATNGIREFQGDPSLRKSGGGSDGDPQTELEEVVDWNALAPTTKGTFFEKLNVLLSLWDDGAEAVLRDACTRGAMPCRSLNRRTRA